MPELPEVETVKRTLKNFILGKKIEDIEIYHANIIDGDEIDFISTLKGQRIQDIDRVGKYLIFLFDSVSVICHLRMEGKFNIVDNDYLPTKHDHVVFKFSDQTKLCYHDTRKFGRMQLSNIEGYKEMLPLSKLGKEPFFADVDVVYKRLSKSNKAIKTVLLDQTILAGIGNIYANEICFFMNLNPTTPASRLSKKRVSELIEISSQVLHEAILQGGTTIHSFDSNGIHGLFQVHLAVHGQKECKKCGTKITKEMLNQRGTYYCKKCQRRTR